MTNDSPVTTGRWPSREPKQSNWPKGVRNERLNCAVPKNSDEAKALLDSGAGVGFDLTHLALVTGSSLADVEARVLAALKENNEIFVLDSLFKEAYNYKTPMFSTRERFYGKSSVSELPVVYKSNKPYNEPEPQEPRTVSKNTVKARRARNKRARKARRRG